MPEVSHAGEHHRDPEPVGGGDHLGVARRAARLDAGGGAGGGAISAGCGSPGGGVVISTSVNTPCSLNLGAVLGAAAANDLRVEIQPSHGNVVWSSGILTYTPVPDYRGRDSFTVSTTTKTLVNGQLVEGRGNQVWGIVVQ